jgi:hypothetical protein
MAIEVVTFFSTLCKLARAEYEANISGDIEKYEKAKQNHENYRTMCLNCNKMIVDTRRNLL